MSPSYTYGVEGTVAVSTCESHNSSISYKKNKKKYRNWGLPPFTIFFGKDRTPDKEDWDEKKGNVCGKFYIYVPRGSAECTFTTVDQNTQFPYQSATTEIEILYPSDVKVVSEIGTFPEYNKEMHISLVVIKRNDTNVAAGYKVMVVATESEILKFNGQIILNKDVKIPNNFKFVEAYELAVISKVPTWEEYLSGNAPTATVKQRRCGQFVITIKQETSKKEIVDTHYVYEFQQRRNRNLMSSRDDDSGEEESESESEEESSDDQVGYIHLVAYANVGTVTKKCEGDFEYAQGYYSIACNSKTRAVAIEYSYYYPASGCDAEGVMILRLPYLHIDENGEHADTYADHIQAITY